MSVIPTFARDNAGEVVRCRKKEFHRGNAEGSREYLFDVNSSNPGVFMRATDAREYTQVVFGFKTKDCGAMVCFEFFRKIARWRSKQHFFRQNGDGPETITLPQRVDSLEELNYGAAAPAAAESRRRAMRLRSAFEGELHSFRHENCESRCKSD